MFKSSCFSIFKAFLAAVCLPIAWTTAGAQANFGSVKVGSSAESIVTVTFPAAGTIGSIGVVTQGVPGLDFADAGTGSCTVGVAYAAAAKCTVAVKFKPEVSGRRYGAAVLHDGAGTALATAFVYGIGLGPQIVFSPGQVSALGPTVSGQQLAEPAAVASDAAGDLFIADCSKPVSTGNCRVLKLPFDGGPAAVFAPTLEFRPLSHVTGLAVDGAGNLLIADFGNSRIVEMPADGSPAFDFDPSVTVSGSATSSPASPRGVILANPSGLLIADYFNNRIMGVPTNGNPFVLDATASGVTSEPVSVAADAGGDLFVLDASNSRIVELPAGAGAATAIVPIVNGVGLQSPSSLAIDVEGDLFLADTGNSRVVELPAGGGPATVVASTANGQGSNVPSGVAVDDAGDLLIADTGHSRIVEIQGSLPAALTYDSTLVGAASASQQVTLTNTGNAPLLISSIEVSGANASSFVFANTCGSSLAVGASCTIHGHLMPQAAGPLAAVLTITDNLNQPSGAQQTIALSGTGLAPGSTTVSIYPTELAFGTQELHFMTDSQVIVLQNTGAQTLNLNSIRLTGTGHYQFEYSNVFCPLDMLPGYYCYTFVRFDPQATGPATAAITFTDSAVGSPQSVVLTGTGTSSPLTKVSLSPANLDFGNVQVGTSGASRQATLTNTGKATLSIASLTVAGANASSFVFEAYCPSSMTPGQSCPIGGHFSPTTTGPLSAVVTIVDNASGSPQTIALTGTGVSTPITTVSLSVSSLTYGNQAVGTASQPQAFMLTNTGTGTLVLGALQLTGPNASSFGFASDCPATVAPGGSCFIHGHFSPTALGPLTASLVINDNIAGTLSVALSGTGVPPPFVTLSGTSLSFGSQLVGTSSASQDIVLTNTGGATLSIFNFSVGGANASSFAFGNGCGSSVAVGASCAIHGHFAPTTTGPLTATITLYDDGGPAEQGAYQTITVTGTGK